MEGKSAWEKFFDDMEDIECISCLDACVLEYFIDDCRVQVNRLSPGKYSINIRGYDNKKDLYTSDFSKEWKKKNIYDQAIYKKFVSGYFFHENEKVEIEFDQEELQLLYAACIGYRDKIARKKKNVPDEAKQLDEIWKIAKKITEYMEDRSNVQL